MLSSVVPWSSERAHAAQRHATRGRWDRAAASVQTASMGRKRPRQRDPERSHGKAARTAPIPQIVRVHQHTRRAARTQHVPVARMAARPHRAPEIVEPSVERPLDGRRRASPAAAGDSSSTSLRAQPALVGDLSAGGALP